MKVRNEIKVGLVALIAIGLLYFGMSYLKGSNVFSESRYFYAVYKNVAQLQNDNEVVLNGVKVGRVANIKLLPDDGNKILVKMEIIQNDLKIPDSSKAIIASLDLLGTKGIELELSELGSFHVSGDTLIPELKKDVVGVVEEKLAPIQREIELVIIEARDLIAKTQIMIETTNESVKKAQTSMEVINKTTKDVDIMVQEQNENLTKGLTDIDAIASNIRSKSKQINTIIDNVATISDSLTRANYASAIENASSALNQLDLLITKINDGEGSLGLLINDDKLYNNLEQASLEIDKLAEDLRVNPSRYVHFSVFGKKEKSEEKLKKKARDDDNSDQ